MPRAPLTPADYWDLYKPQQGDGPPVRPAAPRFEWTQYPGHGPGAEVLGSPVRALDMGPAEGVEAASLALTGVEVTGVDLSPMQSARARALWEGVEGLDFMCADVCAFLGDGGAQYDAIYSVWGAVWFTDPEALLPLVFKRLAAGGVFAFSQAEPAGGLYGPQPMRGKWLEGRDRELTVMRWQYPASAWADMLKQCGFEDVDARVLPAPDAAKLGTLLVRATAPS